MNEDGKTGGFKFALTALTTIGALLYTAASYYQRTAIDIKYYDTFINLISVLFVLFTFLLFYIFIKGYSLELNRNKDSDLIKSNEKKASTIYILAFLIFIMILSSVILIFTFSKIFGNLNDTLYYIIFFLSVLSSYIIGWPSLELESKPDYEKMSKAKQIFLKLYLGAFLLMVGLIYVIIVSFLILNFPLSGHVTFDMQSIYYQNDGQIPINIKVTGPIYESQLKLYKENSENNLTLIDQLRLMPEHNSSKKRYGIQSILSGNSFELGTYNSFINITNPNMTVGYYELIYSFSKYEYGKGFYLINKSEV